MFERFTDSARATVVYAQEASRLLRHDHIGTTHLLLGLLRDDGPTRQLLDSAGARPDAVRAAVERDLGHGRKPPHGHIPFSPHAKKTLEYSLRASLELQHDVIGPPHLLLGLLRGQDFRAVRLLAGLGVDLAALAEAAAALARKSVLGVAPMGQRRVPGRPDALIARLRLQRDQLAAALRRYGRHDDACPGASAGAGTGTATAPESVAGGAAGTAVGGTGGSGGGIAAGGCICGLAEALSRAGRVEPDG